MGGTTSPMPSDNPYEAPPPLFDDTPVSAIPRASDDAHWARGSTILALGYAQLLVAATAFTNDWLLPEVIAADFRKRIIACAVPAFIGICILQSWARRAQIAWTLSVLAVSLAALGRNVELGAPVIHGLLCALVQIGTLYLFLSSAGRALYIAEIPQQATAGRRPLEPRAIWLDTRLWVILIKLLVLTVVEFLALIDLTFAVDRVW
jgi:hypothetical protein